MDTVSTGKDSKLDEDRWNPTAMLKAVSVLLSEIINENKAEVQKMKGKLNNYLLITYALLFSLHR